MSFWEKAGQALNATKTFAAKASISHNNDMIKQCNSLERQLAKEYKQAETKSQRQEIARKHANVVNTRNDATTRIDKANEILNKNK